MSGRLRVLLALGLVLAFCAGSASGALAATYQVTNSNDGGPGTLPQAIMDSNAAGGTGSPNTIELQPGHAGVAIGLDGPLPPITYPVVLDGTGIGLYNTHVDTAAFVALDLAAGSSGSMVNGLGLQGFAVGIGVSSSNDVISGNSLSLNTDGIQLLAGATGNTVGGTAGSAANVLQSNTVGVEVGASGATGVTGNTVEGNVVGTGVSGGSVGNSVGVQIDTGASANTVGGSAAGAGNLISANHDEGVLLTAGTTGNVVAGNDIGTNAAGTAAVPNGDGVVIDGGASNNTIGGSAAGAVNLISGNTGEGVAIGGAGTSGNVVENNDIGTSAQASGSAIPNGTGAVQFSGGASGNTVEGGVEAAGGTGPAIDLGGAANHVLGTSLAGPSSLIIGGQGMTATVVGPVLSGSSAGYSITVSGGPPGGTVTAGLLSTTCSSGGGGNADFLGDTKVTLNSAGSGTGSVTVSTEPANVLVLLDGSLGTANLPGTCSGVAPTPPTPPPTVASVNPSTGPAAGGTTVKITGTNLSGVTAVKFAGTPAHFVAVSDTEVDADSPAGTGTVDVTVSTPGGTSATSAADKFAYGPGPPTASFTVSPDATGGIPVTFDGSPSHDPNIGGSITRYSWDFGDGTAPVTGAKVTHTYPFLRTTYQVTLTVTGSGGTGVTMQPVSVDPGKPTGITATITGPTNGLNVPYGAAVDAHFACQVGAYELPTYRGQPTYLCSATVKVGGRDQDIADGAPLPTTVPGPQTLTVTAIYGFFADSSTTTVQYTVAQGGALPLQPDDPVPNVINGQLVQGPLTLGVARPIGTTVNVDMGCPAGGAALCVSYVGFEVQGIPAQVGLYDSTTGMWYLQARAKSFLFGLPAGQVPDDPTHSIAEIPVTGDWTGTGHTGIGVVDPVNNTWALRSTPSAGFPTITVQFGNASAGDIPVTGDWLGEGKTGIGEFNPTNGTWKLAYANADDTITNVGSFVWAASAGAGHVPIFGSWTPHGFVGAGNGYGYYDPASGGWTALTHYCLGSRLPCAPALPSKTDPPIPNPCPAADEVSAGFGGSFCHPSGWYTSLPVHIEANSFSDDPAPLKGAPVTGDWDGIGLTGIGVFRSSSSSFAVHPIFSDGRPDPGSTATATTPAGTLVPVSGMWPPETSATATDARAPHKPAKTKPNQSLLVAQTLVKVPRGRHKIVKLTLNAAGRRLLAARHTLKVVMILLGPSPATVKTIVFHSPPAKKHKPGTKTKHK